MRKASSEEHDKVSKTANQRKFFSQESQKTSGRQAKMKRPWSEKPRQTLHAAQKQQTTTKQIPNQEQRWQLHNKKKTESTPKKKWRCKVRLMDTMRWTGLKVISYPCWRGHRSYQLLTVLAGLYYSVRLKIKLMM